MKAITKLKAIKALNEMQTKTDSNFCESKPRIATQISFELIFSLINKQIIISINGKLNNVIINNSFITIKTILLLIIYLFVIRLIDKYFNVFKVFYEIFCE